jgi:hypothetical protein
LGYWSVTRKTNMGELVVVWTGEAAAQGATRGGGTPLSMSNEGEAAACTTFPRVVSTRATPVRGGSLLAMAGWSKADGRARCALAVVGWEQGSCRS